MLDETIEDGLIYYTSDEVEGLEDIHNREYIHKYCGDYITYNLKDNDDDMWRWL